MPLLRGSRRNIAIQFGVGKVEWWGYPMVKKIEDMYNRLDTIPACDRRTDGRTDEQKDGHLATALSIVPAMHTRRAVKMDRVLKMYKISWSKKCRKAVKINVSLYSIRTIKSRSVMPLLSVSPLNVLTH